MSGGTKGKVGAPMQAIDLTKLNLMQLTQFKNQLDQDLQFYQESLQNLKHAQTRYSIDGNGQSQCGVNVQHCAGSKSPGTP
jgi:hypothetical protein